MKRLFVVLGFISLLTVAGLTQAPFRIADMMGIRRVSILNCHPTVGPSHSSLAMLTGLLTALSTTFIQYPLIGLTRFLDN